MWAYQRLQSLSPGMLKHKIRPLLPHAALLLAHQKGLLATAAGAVWWQCCAAYLLCISILHPPGSGPPVGGDELFIVCKCVRLGFGHMTVLFLVTNLVSHKWSRSQSLTALLSFLLSTEPLWPSARFRCGDFTSTLFFLFLLLHLFPLHVSTWQVGSSYWSSW